MTRRKHEFAETDKIKALLWSARHCCLCGKQAGVGIEIAHLSPKSSDLGNAMPLCFDCHAAVGHYNRDHPRGRKYGIAELTARRDQVYEEHTRHLVPPVEYRLAQRSRTLPDVGFEISNLGNSYPIRAHVTVRLAQDGASPKVQDSGHYDGRYAWNLNPGFGVTGHFSADGVSTSAPLHARVDVTLVDIYDRPHRLLPVGFVLAAAAGDWYLEPSIEGLLPELAQAAGRA